MTSVRSVSLRVAVIAALLLSTAYLCFEFFRLTSVVGFLALNASVLTVKYHRRTWIPVSMAIAFVGAIAAPVDVYWQPMHGPLVHRSGTGPRFVPATYGLALTSELKGEQVMRGCFVTLHDTRWYLVLN